MTASQIRCLLAALALSDHYEQVESKAIAHLLGIKKPTVFSALELLQGKGLIEKAHYGDVHLTEEGLSLARKLETQRDDIALLFSRHYGLSPDESAKAAIMLMGVLKEESLELLQAHK